ncbi:MAG: hypothetical protein H8E32_14840 [Nitrospinae bacterium]|nr:hypothetical protein [Nitrospinota bacterium]
MRKNRIRNGLLLFAIPCFLFLGCGYHLVGTGNTLPPHLKTISIPVFENSSSQPEIHRELTSAILQSFISDGRLKVVKKGDADLAMTGTLSYYNTRSASFNAQDLVSDIIIEIEVEVEVIDRVKDKIFLKKKLKNQWDYKSNSDISATETARLDALDQAYADLGNRLVSLIIDQF